MNRTTATAYHSPRHTALTTSAAHAAARLGAERDYEALRRGYTYQARHYASHVREVAA